MNSRIKIKRGGIKLDNRAEVIINTKNDKKDMSIRIEVSNKDVNEIVNKYALVQHREPNNVNILDFLNHREN